MFVVIREYFNREDLFHDTALVGAFESKAEAEMAFLGDRDRFDDPEYDFDRRYDVLFIGDEAEADVMFKWHIFNTDKTEHFEWQG